MAEIERVDHLIEGPGGLRLHVRHVVVPGSGPAQPLLLLHGARAGGTASFDLDVPGGSLAGDLAATGFSVYVMDARGYGSSDRPAAMREPAEHHRPLVRSVEVVRDIESVVEWICDTAGVDQVAMLGWATGGHWLGYYATLRPERVSHLVMLNSLYGGTIEHPSLGRGSDLEDPEKPGAFNYASVPGWRAAGAASLVAAWVNSAPGAERDSWHDPAIVDAYARTAIAADPSSSTRTPPTLVVPTGALEDSFYLATGRQLWDASLIRAKTLVVRADRDFWSRPGDVDKLVEHLVNAPLVQSLVIRGATHFVHLDRPERGRDELLATVTRFLME